MNFSIEDIQSGKLKDYLRPEDYDLDKRVSFLCLISLSRLSSLITTDFPAFSSAGKYLSQDGRVLVRNDFSRLYGFLSVLEYGFLFSLQSRSRVRYFVFPLVVA